MRHGAGSGEQGAVASEHESEIGALGADRVARYDFFSVGVLRGFLVEIKLVSTLPKPGKQFGQKAGQLGLRRL